MNEQDSFVQEPQHSSWAIWIVIIVVILFGAFWYTERSKESNVTPLPVAKTMPSVDTLQATVIESEIPDFSSQF